MQKTSEQAHQEIKLTTRGEKLGKVIDISRNGLHLDDSIK